MKLSFLTYFIFEVNAVIDAGQHQDITIEEVENHIERGDVVAYLTSRLGDAIDLSLFDQQKAAELSAALQDILGGNRGRERKWGIERSGLCLLVAWTAELIQQKRWEA